MTGGDKVIYDHTLTGDNTKEEIKMKTKDLRQTQT